MAGKLGTVVVTVSPVPTPTHRPRARAQTPAGSLLRQSCFLLGSRGAGQRVLKSWTGPRMGGRLVLSPPGVEAMFNLNFLRLAWAPRGPPHIAQARLMRLFVCLAVLVGAFAMVICPRKPLSFSSIFISRAWADLGSPPRTPWRPEAHPLRMACLNNPETHTMCISFLSCFCGRGEEGRRPFRVAWPLPRVPFPTLARRQWSTHTAKDGISSIGLPCHSQALHAASSMPSSAQSKNDCRQVICCWPSAPLGNQPTYHKGKENMHGTWMDAWAVPYTRGVHAKRVAHFSRCSGRSPKPSGITLRCGRGPFPWGTVELFSGEEFPLSWQVS